MPIVSVTKSPLGKSFTLKLEDGLNEKGEVVYVNKTFSNVYEDALDNNILNTANILASLQSKVLDQVSVQEKYALLS